MVAASKATGDSVDVISRSVKKGLTKPPESHNRSYEWQGEQYPTIAAITRIAKVDHRTMRRWLADGFTDFPPNRRQVNQYLWRGEIYTSLCKVAETAKVGVPVIKRWLNMGLSDYPEDWKRKYEWRGEWYPTLEAVAEAAGVCRGTIIRWRARGLTDYPEKFKRTYRWRNRDWPSISAIAREENVSGTAVAGWLKRGLTEPPSKPHRGIDVVWRNKTYESFVEAARSQRSRPPPCGHGAGRDSPTTRRATSAAARRLDPPNPKIRNHKNGNCAIV